MQPNSQLPTKKQINFNKTRKKLRKKLRHRLEIPLIILTILILLLTLLTFCFGFLITGVWLYYKVSDLNKNSSAETLVNLFNQFIPLVFIVPILILIVRGILYAKMRTNAVQLSYIQFPKEYKLMTEIANEFYLKELPKFFILLGNGTINAFTAGHGFRRFLVFFSDLFEVGAESRHPNVLKFVMAHELGHIAAGHTSYFRILLMQYANIIPILGSALSRAQEYTADNYGYYFAPEGAKKTIATLGAGKYLVNQIDFTDIVKRAVFEKGFFIWIVNLIASHPVLTWRAYALEFRQKPGKVFFRPKKFPTLQPTNETQSASSSNNNISQI